MNPKSRLLVKHNEHVIEMNTTFAKMMQNPMSDEYALLQKVKMENQGFRVQTRQIKSNPKKDTYKGLTYDRMKEYITKYSVGEEQKNNLAELEKMIDISKCHGQSLRYPTIKKWFLNKYPEVAKFGIIEAIDQAESEESKSQNVVPFSAAKTAEEAEATEIKKVG